MSAYIIYSILSVIMHCLNSNIFLPFFPFFEHAKQFHKNLSFYILIHEVQVCFLLQKNENNSNKKKSPWCFDVTDFGSISWLDNVNSLGIIKRIIRFSQFELISEI